MVYPVIYPFCQYCLQTNKPFINLGFPGSPLGSPKPPGSPPPHEAAPATGSLLPQDDTEQLGQDSWGFFDGWKSSELWMTPRLGDDEF